MSRIIASLFLLVFIAFNTFAYASEPEQPLTPQEQQALKVLKPAIEAAIFGPKNVSLLGEATIDIPQGYIYIPPKEAAALMRLLGNARANDGLAGMITTADLKFENFIVINYIDIGHIYDYEAKDLKSDDLLKVIQKKTEEANSDRVNNNLDPLQILGWITLPTYDPATHSLDLSMETKEGSIREANYRGLILGRDGVTSFTLVSPYASFGVNQALTREIISSFKYNVGNRYEDFRANTDKVASYGLAALITGVVAKKAGLLALAGALFVKLWKALLLLPIIFWTKIKKVLGLADDEKASDTK